jgi:hypothetical protein
MTFFSMSSTVVARGPDSTANGWVMMAFSCWEQLGEKCFQVVASAEEVVDNVKLPCSSTGVTLAPHV